MEGKTVKRVLQGVLSSGALETEARRQGVVKRKRTICVVSLVIALVLNGGSEEDRGRLSSVHREYQDLADVEAVGQSGFNARFTEALSGLMVWVLWRALERARAQPVLLGGILADVPGGIVDWLVMDAETVKVHPNHADVYDNGNDGAALKVHKLYSLGRLTMIAIRLSASREHDNKLFEVTEAWRHHGILLDLAYASLELLDDCATHQVRYVIRLKEGWKPKVCGRLLVDEYEDFDEPQDFRMMLARGDITLLDGTCDVDVLCGPEGLPARLVGVLTPEGEQRFYLTNLPRISHSPRDVATIYRCRWDIEIDNKVDKTASRLDHTRFARSPHTLHILICAALMHSITAGMLAHQHRLAVLKQGKWGQRPPLHKIALALAIASFSHTLHDALLHPELAPWQSIAHKLEIQSHDKNWRNNPSVLDIIMGDTAPPGRPRNKTLQESPPEAYPFFFRELEWKRATQEHHSQHA